MTTGRILPFAFIAFLLATGLAFLLESLTYEYMASFGPGPGLLPRCLAGGMLICTAFVLYEEYMQPEEVWAEPGGPRRVLAAIGLMAGAAAGISYIGMLPSLFVFIFLFASPIEKNSYRFSLLLSTGIVAATYLIFGLWLGVQFPEVYYF